MNCDRSVVFLFFKQKTAYEMLISDWSSDVCSSDLATHSVNATVVACSSNHQLNSNAMVTNNCAMAPADARNRIPRSGSLNQATTCTLSVGGRFGPRIIATSTVDDA